MGNVLSGILDKLRWGNVERKMLMVGLDGAGKTTILTKLKLNIVKETVPTIGFNHEDVEFKNIKFSVFDVGGQDKIRALWKHYILGCDGLIFVVDSSDTKRIDEAKTEFHRIVNNFLEEYNRSSKLVVLVFANKQDLPNAMCRTEMAEKLELKSLRRCNWHIQGASAINSNDDGLFLGLEWLSDNMSKYYF